MGGCYLPGGIFIVGGSEINAQIQRANTAGSLETDRFDPNPDEASGAGGELEEGAGGEGTAEKGRWLGHGDTSGWKRDGNTSGAYFPASVVLGSYGLGLGAATRGIAEGKPGAEEGSDCTRSEELSGSTEGGL